MRMDVSRVHYGWTRFAIARSASAAPLAVGFAIFSMRLKGTESKLLYDSTSTFPSAVCSSSRWVPLPSQGAHQLRSNPQRRRGDLLTSIVLLDRRGLGAFYANGDWSHLSQANVSTCEGVAIVSGGFAGFAAAMLGALWAYDGWNNISFLAGEVKNPERNLPLGLIISMFIVMGLYLLVNIGYYHVLTPTEVASVPASLSVAAEVVRRLLGAIALTLMAAAMMTSSFGALHASILATSRVPYAMARDRLFFKGLAKLSPRTHVPIRSLVVLGVWSSVLALSGSYDQLTDAAVFALTLFYAFVAGSVFIFRHRQPDVHRPYRTWGYPAVPIVYLAVVGWLLSRIVWDSRSDMSATIGCFSSHHSRPWRVLKAPPLT